MKGIVMAKEFSIGVVIDLPQSELTNRIINIKDELAGEFDNYHTFHPHISIHMSAFPFSNFKKFQPEFEELEIPRFEVAIRDISLALDSDYLMIELEYSEELFDIHQDMLDLVNKYRGGLIRNKDVERLNSGYFDEIEKFYLQEYGYTRVLDKFAQHITLGKISNNRDKFSEYFSSNNRFRDLVGKKINAEQLTAVLFETDSGAGVEPEEKCVVSLE